MTTIGIIGTAFRGDLIYRCDVRTFELIVEAVRMVVSKLPKPWHFVSGGAAGVDHVAVHLRMRGFGDALTLHLPAPFRVNRDFFDDSRFVETTDAGRFANYHHRRFSERVSGEWPHNSFAELAYVVQTGIAHVEVHGGFHARNLLVGQVDVLTALTFGDGQVPADGGTRHTWDHSDAATKIHIPIGKLQHPPPQQNIFSEGL